MTSLVNVLIADGGYCTTIFSNSMNLFYFSMNSLEY